jgi:hypothetical protein
MYQTAKPGIFSMSIAHYTPSSSHHELCRRYYLIAGITVQVEVEIPITDTTFHPKFKVFEVDGPGSDNVIIRHGFPLPDTNILNQGEQIYRRSPWVIYKSNGSWIYGGISPDNSWTPLSLVSHAFRRLNPYPITPGRKKRKSRNTNLFPGRSDNLYLLAVCNRDHTRVTVYNRGKGPFRRGNLHSLTLFSTDQILLARVLAERKGCYIHASGVVLNKQGLLFVGHSGAGKSTIATMLKNKAEILCDDRIIVRKWEDGFRIHGTWSHGDLPDISAGSAPLKAIFFLEQDKQNRLCQIDSKHEAATRLLACLVKPLVTADWWDRMLSLVGMMTSEIPCYVLHFNKSGEVVAMLQEL